MGRWRKDIVFSWAGQQGDIKLLSGCLSLHFRQQKGVPGIPQYVPGLAQEPGQSKGRRRAAHATSSEKNEVVTTVTPLRCHRIPHILMILGQAPGTPKLLLS